MLPTPPTRDIFLISEYHEANSGQQVHLTLIQRGAATAFKAEPTNLAIYTSIQGGVGVRIDIYNHVFLSNCSWRVRGSYNA